MCTGSRTFDMADLFIATVPHPVSEQAVFQPALRQYLSNHFDLDTNYLPPFSPGEATRLTISVIGGLLCLTHPDLRSVACAYISIITFIRSLINNIENRNSRLSTTIAHAIKSGILQQNRYRLFGLPALDFEYQ